MAKLMHNGVEIANTLQRYDDIIDKPTINGVELKVGNNTSIDLGIIWQGTQAEYDALTEINPQTIYMVTDDEATANEADYLKLSNQPAIGGVVLTGDKSLSSLNIYSKTEVDDLLATSKSVIVVTAAEWEDIKDDPTKLHKNTVYYVGTDAPDVFNNYLVDNAGTVYPLNSGAADMSVYQLKHPTDDTGADIIKAGDGTVVGALNTIGKVTDLTTTNKTSVVAAVNELNANKYDNTKYIKRTKGQFGDWNGTSRNHCYKLADITFIGAYCSFVATLRLMNTYNQVKVGSTEISFNLRSGNASSSAGTLDVMEVRGNNIPADFPKGKMDVFITYNKPSAWPKKAEIWVRTYASRYEEFTFEWLVKNASISDTIPTMNLIEKPAYVTSSPNIGNQYSWDLYDLCVMRNAVEMNNATLSNQTRANMISQLNGRTEYIYGNVKFTAAESPTKNATDSFNVHAMWQSASKMSLVATNPANALMYTSVYNGTSWSAWSEVGATGDPTVLIDASSDIKFQATVVDGFKISKCKYYYTDMGTYYINALSMELTCTIAASEYARTRCNGEFGKLLGLKGYPTPGNAISGVPYFNTVMDDEQNSDVYSWGHGQVWVMSDSKIYINGGQEIAKGWPTTPKWVVTTFISFK